MKCPVLKEKGAIQNKITSLKIFKNMDTLGVSLQVVGMNTAQEKNWNINQIDRFLIQGDKLIKVFDYE